LNLHVADDLSFPARAVTETFGILAVRGAGKSNTAAVMAEEMFKAKLPFVVVDPVRAWYGLRASADGKGPGLPIPIFGGRRGDVPLERGAGNLMADLVVDQRLSCVLDLSDFDSEGSKKQFLLDFGRRLYQRNEQPLHLFLEEADDYIPQRPMRDEAQLLRAWENIVRRGRNRGLGEIDLEHAHPAHQTPVHAPLRPSVPDPAGQGLRPSRAVPCSPPSRPRSCPGRPSSRPRRRRPT
jgi:DNA helicase HerA-like ATPase